MPHNPEKRRLDQLLVERGLADSREKARRLIMAGGVKLEGVASPKPGMVVPIDAGLEISQRDRYVGRGGLKLEEALRKFAVTVRGRRCLDIGASTGGFTDCLLQHGAERVVAVDVGHGQLDWKLRKDPRVDSREGVNCRFLTAEVAGGADFGVITADVSFISLTLILPPVFDLMAPDGDFIVLIKPQFELTRREVGKGGVVRDAALHRAAVEKIRAFVTTDLGVRWMDVVPSPVAGASGNREFLAWLKP